MSILEYNNQELYIEQVAFSNIANKFATPCYVYSKHAIANNWNAFYNALTNSNKPFKIHYAVKANSNIAILRLLAKLGAGFDVVSGGEIERVLIAGGKPENIVFSGVGKTTTEIKNAISLNVNNLHIESEQELFRINDIAKTQNKIVNIAIRVNPDVISGTHPYISTGSKHNKFDIDFDKALYIYKQAKLLSNITIAGIACHIGSQLTSLGPFLQAIDQLLILIKSLQEININLKYIDIGGGLGVCYKDEKPPTVQEYIAAIVNKLQHTKLELRIEPGRAIVANAGIILTKVEYIKTTANNNFAIVDAAMNDLLRPSLYQSFHDVMPVHLYNTEPDKNYNIVGPICESGDFLALNRSLNLKPDDLLIIKDCGAYGFSMSSNYNTRPRCAEVLVDKDQISLIRKRETVQQLLENEIL